MTKMDVPTASAQYRDAVKKISHYGRLYRQADYGGKHSAQRTRYASQQRQWHETRRDEALAALHATSEGVAWLEAQEHARVAANARAMARFRADNLRRLVDEYLLASQLTTLRQSEWRMYATFGRRAEASDAKRLYEAARELLEGLTRSINEHDAWRAVSRRSAQLLRAGRNVGGDDALVKATAP